MFKRFWLLISIMWAAMCLRVFGTDLEKALLGEDLSKAMTYATVVFLGPILWYLGRFVRHGHF
jgi:hypothetical protein